MTINSAHVSLMNPLEFDNKLRAITDFFASPRDKENHKKVLEACGLPLEEANIFPAMFDQFGASTSFFSVPYYVRRAFEALFTKGFFNTPDYFDKLLRFFYKYEAACPVELKSKIVRKHTTLEETLNYILLQMNIEKRVDEDPTNAFLSDLMREMAVYIINNYPESKSLRHFLTRVIYLPIEETASTSRSTQPPLKRAEMKAENVVKRLKKYFPINSPYYDLLFAPQYQKLNNDELSGLLEGFPSKRVKAVSNTISTQTINALEKPLCLGSLTPSVQTSDSSVPSANVDFTNDVSSCYQDSLSSKNLLFKTSSRNYGNAPTSNTLEAITPLPLKPIGFFSDSNVDEKIMQGLSELWALMNPGQSYGDLHNPS